MADDRIVNLPFAVDAQTWINLLIGKGIVIPNPEGQYSFEPKVNPILSALHQVLAGGTVQITTVTQGDQGVKAELDDALANALTQTNEVIADHGSDVCMP